MNVNGITYKPNCAVVCVVIDEEPTLAKVRDIYIMDCNRVVFEIQSLNNKGFNKHYHAFIVESTNTYTTILLNMLISPFSLHIRRLNIHSIPLLAIIMKHHITRTLPGCA